MVKNMASVQGGLGAVRSRVMRKECVAVRGSGKRVRARESKIDTEGDERREYEEEGKGDPRHRQRDL